MAKRRPKLGDVKYRKSNPNFDVYGVYVYYDSAWRLQDVERGLTDARRSAKTLRIFMRKVIREARESDDG